MPLSSRSGAKAASWCASPIIKDFHIHVIFAADKLIAERPDALRAFLAGWFETIEFMRKNKAETVAIAKEVMNKDEDITLAITTS